MLATSMQANEMAIAAGYSTALPVFNTVRLQGYSLPEVPVDLPIPPEQLMFESKPATFGPMVNSAKRLGPVETIEVLRNDDISHFRAVCVDFPGAILQGTVGDGDRRGGDMIFANTKLSTVSPLVISYFSLQDPMQVPPAERIPRRSFMHWLSDQIEDASHALDRLAFRVRHGYWNDEDY